MTRMRAPAELPRPTPDRWPGARAASPGSRSLIRVARPSPSSESFIRVTRPSRLSGPLLRAAPPRRSRSEGWMEEACVQYRGMFQTGATCAAPVAPVTFSVAGAVVCGARRAHRQTMLHTDARAHTHSHTRACVRAHTHTRARAARAHARTRLPPARAHTHTSAHAHNHALTYAGTRAHAAVVPDRFRQFPTAAKVLTTKRSILFFGPAQPRPSGWRGPSGGWGAGRFGQFLTAESF